MGNNTNSSFLATQEVLKSKLITCLFGKVQEDDLSMYYVGVIEHFYINNKLRSATWSKAMDNTFVGLVEPIPEETPERLMKCSGL
jgi:hypothetical protein